jgi:hypothetical protein
MTTVGKLKDGDLYLQGEVSERAPTITNGLVAHIPFDDTDIGVSYRNLLRTSDWKVGTSGSQGMFSQNGETGANQIILKENPWGTIEPTWATIGNDATSDADGGWNTTGLSIDHTKKYRLSVWVRREAAGNGRTYFGCQQSSVCNLGGTTVNTNPYFTSRIISERPELADNWTLWVAYIHPSTYTGGNDSTNGIYTMDGKKLQGLTDYKWVSGRTTGGHRAYLYYSTSTGERQYFARPRMEICDGSESTIDEMLRGEDNKFRPISSTNVTVTENGISVDTSTTNLWNGGLNIYNNYGVPATLTQLDETYMGQPVYRLGMTVTDPHADHLSHFRSSLSSHGVHGGSMSWVLDTPYVSSIYWRPVNKHDVVFGGTASNTAGWSVGGTEYLENGWRRFYRYRTGAGVATKSDAIHHSFYCPSLQLNETIYIDICCPQTEQGRTFPTAYVNGARGGSSVIIYPGEVINQSSGTIVMKVTDPNDTGTRGIFTIGDYSQNRTQIYKSGNNLYIWINGGNSYKALTWSGYATLAFTWTGTQMKLYVNGTHQVTYSSGLFPGLKEFFAIGNRYAGSWGAYGNIQCRDVSIYDRALTDEEITRISKGSFTVTKNGNMMSVVKEDQGTRITKDNYFPLGNDGADKHQSIKPLTESNVVFENGGVWVGKSTANVYDLTKSSDVWPSDSSNMNALTTVTGKNSFRVKGISTVNGAYSYVYPKFTASNVIYSFSFKVRNLNNKPVRVTYRIRDGSNGLNLGSVKEGTVHPGEVIYFKHNEHTAVTLSQMTPAISIYSDTTDGTVDAEVFDIQVESGSVCSPFTESSRSQGLLELPASLVTGQNFAFSLWATTDFDNTYNMPFDAYPHLYVGMRTDYKRVQFSFHNNGTQTNIYSASNILKPGKWHHIAGIKTSSGVSMYVDGKKEATHTASGTGYNTTIDGSGRITVGSYDASYPLNGYVRDLIIDSGAVMLDEAMIKEIYRNQMKAYKDNRMQVQGKIIEGRVL